MSKYNVEILPVGRTECGEGPHWDEKTQQLVYVDIPGKSVHRYDPATGKEHKVLIDESGEKAHVPFAVPVQGQADKYLIGYGRSICVLTWNGQGTTKVSPKQLKTLHSVEATNPINRFNDAKCDPSGRLWAGSMGIDWQNTAARARGVLVHLDTAGKLTQHFDKIDLSNGLAWSPDQKQFYFIDSFAYRVDGFDYEAATGRISNRRVVFDFKTNNVEGIPDGMCIDSEGMLWVAVYDGAKVIRVNPNTGKLIEHIDLPEKQITSVAFGGKNLDELYVTAAYQGMTFAEAEAKKAGHLYKVTGTGAKGLSAGVAYAGNI